METDLGLTLREGTVFSQNTMRERRIDPRTEVSLEAEYLLQADDAWCPGTLQNLSAQGVALLIEAEPPGQTELRGIRFTIPAEEGEPECRIEVGAEIVRSWRPTGMTQGSCGLGLRFVDMDQGQFKQIQRFVFNRLTREPIVGLDRNERITIQRPIAVRFGRFEEFVDEVSENLSMTGMFIKAKQPSAPGSIFDLEFVLGDDFPLVEARAEVVWTRLTDGGPHRPVGMGVRFLSLDPSSRKVIRRLVMNRRQENAVRSPQAIGSSVAVPPDSNAVPPPETDTGLEARALKMPADPPEAESVRQSLEETSAENQQLRADLERAAEAERSLREQVGDTNAALVESESRRAELSEQVAAVSAARDGLYQELERLRASDAPPGEDDGRANGKPRRAAMLATGMVLGALLLFAFRDLIPRVDGLAWPGGPETEDATDIEPAYGPTAEPVEPTPSPAMAETSSTTAAEEMAPAPTRDEADLATVESTVRAWASSWSQQQVARYLSFYSSGFQPQSGMPRADWEAQRRERILAPEWIGITVSLLEPAVEGPRRVSVSFDQTYKTPSYGDTVRKTLMLIRENGDWKIADERSRPI